MGGSLLILTASLAVTAGLATAANTTNFTPSAQVGQNEWVNGANALGPLPATDNGVYATTATNDADEGYGTFGIIVPAGSIVDGITVRAEAKSTDNTGCQLSVRLSGNAGSNWTGYQTQNLTQTETVLSFGSASNTWGQVWDPTQFSNANFRLEIRNLNGQSCADPSTTSVDWIDVTITYRTMDHGTTNPALSGTVCKSGDFNFIIDMSGSIGAQGSNPSNLQQLKDGINGFVNAFQGGGGDGRYSGTKFNGSTATTITSGYQTFGVFQTAVNALSGPSGLTPTATGINTGSGNNAGDRAGVPNVMFVLTDGSPNKPNTHSDDLNIPETWLQGANGAVAAANSARAGGYVVEAVYLSTPTDPGDTSLPFSNAGDSAWATQVMDQIGGGSHLNADFTSFVDDLFKAIACPPPPPASIHIVKDANPVGPVNVGTPIGFDITVSNSGQGAANDVTIHDDLPAGAGLDWSLSPAFTGCAISGPVGNEDLDCSFASIAAGASKGPIHVVSQTAKGDCATIDNSATVDASNDDPQSDGASVAVRCPDVSVAKTPDAGTVNAGDNAVFTIVVTNAGPGSATNVTLNDPLPAGYAWSVGGPDGASCSIDTVPSPDVLTCAFGTVAPGTRTVTLTAPTTGQDCAVIPNTATVAASNEKAAGANNTDSAAIDVLCGNVGIVKVANPAGPVSAGSDIGFDITVSNTGDGAAQAGHVTDTLPSGIVWTADTATGSATATCSIAAGVLTCDSASMAAGTNFKVHIHGTTDAADCGLVSNSATASSGNDGGGTSSASVTVLCPAIVVTKTADDPSVSAGSPIGFTVTLANNGSGTATGLAFSDALPAGPGIDWAIDGSPAGWSISGSAPNQSLVYAPTTLAGSTTKTVHVVSDTTADSCKTYDNSATVSIGNGSGDQASASTVVDCPDVHVLKTAPIGTISSGDEASFTIVVSNSGPGVAKAVTLTDTLPAGVSWTEDSASCGIAAGVLTCTFDEIASGASATVHVSGITDGADCGVLTNTATVGAGNEPQSTSGDDASTATITVQCPEITVVKTAIHDSISAGEPASFQIVVSNAGPGTAKDVVIKDTLPSGIAWTVDDTTHCDIVAGVLTCTFDTIDAGEHVTVTVTGETSVEDCGTLENTATVTAANDGPIPEVVASRLALDPHSSTATITVQCATVVITKTADASTAVAGGKIGFTIEIKNTGAGTAFGVTASDTLPTGQAWVISPASAGWTIDAGVLKFGPLPLAGGASTSVHIEATTDATDCGVVHNTASFTYDGGSGSDASDVTVRCPDVNLDKTTTDGDGIVEPNQTVTYGIKVSVTDGPVTNAVVTDTLPIGQTYVAGSQSSTPAASSFVVSSDGRTLTWTYASLATGATAATITYDVTIDADAPDAPQVNQAEVCVDEPLVACASDEVRVISQTPGIQVVKTAGDAEDGEVFSTEPGNVTYTYVVHNTGLLPLANVTVTDDNGTPGTGDDFAATCPQTTLAAGESMTCTATVAVTADRTNVATARGFTAEGNPVTDTDSAEVVILTHGLVIAKSNNAPLLPLQLPDGSTANLPTADEGATVTFTLGYTFSGDPLTNGIITDVLPDGLTYVDGSATNSAAFTFESYDATTRTLTWKAATVAASGAVSYKATVDVGASELAQPLENVATIDSDQTEPGSDTSDVFVPVIPKAETSVPTAPRTDILETSSGTTAPGSGLLLVLLALGGLVLAVSFVTPVPERVRRRNRR